MDMHFPLPAHPQSSLGSAQTVPITWMSLMIYLQFGLGGLIILYTLLGISVGHKIASFLLLAALQIGIALPGSYYTFRKNSLFLVIYVAAQIWTGISELTWSVIHVLGGGSWQIVVLLGSMACIQFFAVAMVFCFRDKIVFRQRKEHLDTHLRVSATKNPTAIDVTISAETEPRTAEEMTMTNKSTEEMKTALEMPSENSTRVKELRKMIADMDARVEKRSQENLRHQ